MSELLKAVEEGNFQEVKRMIESGADVDERSFYMYQNATPLNMAVKSGSLEMVKYLVEHGADIHCMTWWGENALHVAVKSGSLEIVKYLVQQGADINWKNILDETALHAALESGFLEIVKYLVENCADINFITLLGETALHSAITSRSLEMVKYLVEHGAKVTREDCRGGDSILWRVCWRGSHVIGDHLLQNGAIEDLNTHDEDSPLYVACVMGHTAVVQTLLKYNVDIQKERVLYCGNDEIINILKHELKKSIKHRGKIKSLQTMDEEKMVKVIYFRMICF